MRSCIFGWPRPSVMPTPAILLFVLWLTGCALPFQPSHVEWVDFIQVERITYLVATNHVGRAPTESDLGLVYARVKRNVVESVHTTNYQPKDGDAAFLAPGTAIYMVRGYAPTFRLAARLEGHLVFYEADTNPDARTGADLLDIGGKVTSIGVNSAQDGVTELTAITDSRQVDNLVSLVLAARVNQGQVEVKGPDYIIAFHLQDGTAVVRAYWRQTGELARGIQLPPEFGVAVQQAVSK